MTQKESIRLFEERKVRAIWDDEQEEWYFSIVDVISILTDSPNPRKYWSVLKTRLKREGSELTTNCSQLKLKADDGKRYKTDVANTEQLLRIIQSIPSKKAEPFKLWLAQIGRERIEETIDPELIDTSLSVLFPPQRTTIFILNSIPLLYVTPNILYIDRIVFIFYDYFTLFVRNFNLFI